ncbi:MAG: Hsp20/alpha crystallin family protein [Bacteroidetes bacterium]|nr:MAG: Hsp20/alpha crystallin family protein [Bacteroidota bacterium]
MLPNLRNRTMLPNLFDEFFNNEPSNFFNTSNDYTIPSVNIAENKNEFKIDFAVPGLKKEDFKIDVKNDILKISSEKKDSKEEKNEKVIKKEFLYSSFERTFILPDSVNSDKIEASYKDGILQVLIPKKEEAKEKPLRTIKIS